MLNSAISVASGIKNLFSGSSSSAKAAATQYKYNLALQQQAQQWSEYAAKNQWAWDKEAKEKAGLNRLYGLSTTAIPGASGSSVGMPEMVSEQSSKRQQMLEAANMMQNWSAQQVQMEKTQQETRTERVNTQLKMVEKISQELDNLYKKKELDSYDKKLEMQLKKDRSEIVRNLASADEATARAGTAREMTKTEKENRKPQERINKWYENNPKLGGFVTSSGELLPPVGKILGGVGTVAGTVLVGHKLKAAKGAIKGLTRVNSARRIRR